MRTGHLQNLFTWFSAALPKSIFLIFAQALLMHILVNFYSVFFVAFINAYKNSRVMWSICTMPLCCMYMGTVCTHSVTLAENHHHPWVRSRVSAFRQTRRDKWRRVTGLSCCVVGFLPMPFIHAHVFCDAPSQLDSTPPVTSALWVPERQSPDSSLKPTPPKCQSNPLMVLSQNKRGSGRRQARKGLI